MELFSIVGAGIVAAVLAIVLRQLRPEYALISSLLAGVVILLAVFLSASELIGEMRSILSAVDLSGEYAEAMFKALGICFVTQLAGDSCRDAGEGAIAGKIELAGRVAVLAVSLPLFRDVLKIAGSLIGI
jgi:stage III sporulation protein AD